MTEIAARLVRPIRRLGPLSLTAICLAVLIVKFGEAQAWPFGALSAGHGLRYPLLRIC